MALNKTAARYSEKEITIFDYLPQVLPVLDMLFIIWVAFNSPAVWITTPIHLALPLVGFASILLFKNKGKAGFYLIGIFTSVPLFFLNCWGNETLPTWMAEFAFIAGGLMLATTISDRFVVLGLVCLSTIFPLYINHNSGYFITTVVLGELAVWFLMERCMRFMDLQKVQIEKQKHLVEEKQKEIIDSINYAKRIQQSQLPNSKYIAKNLEKLKKYADK